MRSTCSGTLAVVLAICLAWPAGAQEGAAAPAAAQASPGLTGKERLGRKWMDEQRIDNCNVPIEKRGTKPRPTICPHVPTS